VLSRVLVLVVSDWIVRVVVVPVCVTDFVLLAAVEVVL
jgi:hypothetical protein